MGFHEDFMNDSQRFHIIHEQFTKISLNKSKQFKKNFVYINHPNMFFIIFSIKLILIDNFLIIQMMMNTTLFLNNKFLTQSYIKNKKFKKKMFSENL